MLLGGWPLEKDGVGEVKVMGEVGVGEISGEAGGMDTTVLVRGSEARAGV